MIKINRVNNRLIINLLGLKIKIKIPISILTKNVFKIYKNKYYFIYKNKCKELRKIANLRKIRVCFFVQETSKWNLQILYNMLDESFEFEPFVVVSKLQNTILKNKYQENIDFFKKHCKNVLAGYDETNNQSIDLKEFKPDIIFYQQPWELYENQNVEYTSTFALTYHISYSVSDAPDVIKSHLSDFYSVLYKYLIINNFEKNMITKNFGYEFDNIVITGHPKFDVYKNYDKDDYNHEYIIYAPHHSFDKKSLLQYGTFYWNGKEILEWAKSHPKEKFVFKPHPKLKGELLSSGYMSEKEINDYYKEWQDIGIYCNDGDYIELFKKSKCLITDCGSFLAEYMPTEQPVIHLTNKKSAEHCITNAKAAEVYYKATNINELNDLLNNVIIDKNDYLKEKRIAMLNIIYNKKINSSLNIFKELKNDLGIK